MAATLITLVVAAALKISAFGTGICIAVPGNVIVVVSALVGCAGASIVLAGSFSGDGSHAGGGWIAIGGIDAGVWLMSQQVSQEVAPGSRVVCLRR